MKKEKDENVDLEVKDLQSKKVLNIEVKSKALSRISFCAVAVAATYAISYLLWTGIVLADICAGYVFVKRSEAEA